VTRLLTLLFACLPLVAQPTFNKDIVPILQQHCQVCHHTGAIGGFSLMTYADAQPHIREIGVRVGQRTMPVWKPVPGIGDFQDPQVLTQTEVDTVTQWSLAGGPEGDPKDAPPPLSFPDGWTLGQPDLVLTVKAPFTVPPGEDLYRCFSLPTNLPRDTYISAVEIRAGDRAIVHHAVVYPDPLGQSLQLAGNDPSASYTCFGDAGVQSTDAFLAAWAPGITPASTPAGVAMKLSAGSRLAMQLHYHPSDTGGTDQSQLGLYFAKGPVDKLLHQSFLLNTDFIIPAGNSNYPVTASTGLTAARHAVSVFPHMHLLGHTVQAQVTGPDGTVIPLLQIDDWDFDYQAIYQYRIPMALPANSVFSFRETFDNSANNPQNPNSPPKAVSWGTSTTDEMAVVGLGYTLDSEHLLPPQVSAAGIVNSASLASGPAAPGAVMSLYGVALGSFWESASSTPLPRTLGHGVKVTIDGVDAPLFYVSPSQVNFQVPFEASAGNLTFTREDGFRQTIQLPMQPANPGIYTIKGDGTGPALASSVNRGDWTVIYANGLGVVTPGVPSGAAPDGLSSATNTVTVKIGGIDSEVYFAGLAPGFVGLFQINVHVPPTVAPGDAVPITVTVAGATSNAATLSVK
jgi:uncharacterized protein (TIGR03437 family)